MAGIEQYSVYAYDINTNTLICQIPARNLSFDERLNDSGSINFDIDISRAEVANRVAPLMDYLGVPFAVYVDTAPATGISENSIIWSGVIWTWDYSRSSGTITLGGKTWLSYLSTRFIDRDYTTSINPGQLVYDVLSRLPETGIPGSSIPNWVIIDGSPWSSQRITPDYRKSQYVSVAQVLSDMATIDIYNYGCVEVAWFATWNLTTGRPEILIVPTEGRIGAAGSDTEYGLDLEHAIDYTWPVDSTQMGNVISVTGSGTKSVPTYRRTLPLTDFGHEGQPPMLEKYIACSNISSKPILRHMVYGFLSQYGVPITTPSVTQPVASTPGLYSGLVGNDTRVYIHSDFIFPDGLDVYKRIVQVAVTVPEEGVATVTYTLNDPPANIPET